jgi:8-oxo-dGTP pyrophosphatase MutT (NUDIX family)
MALPGGRRAGSDADLVDTAIREALEEVGMLLERDQLAGRLADVIPRTPTLPPIAVRPFVFVVSDRPNLRLNPEVSTVAWIPVDHLLRRETYRPVQLELRGETREFPAYHLEDAFVWGMTERILSDLLEEFRRAES